MRVITTEDEHAVARATLLPQKYRHFRQSIWQNYTDIGTCALQAGDAKLAQKMFFEALQEAKKETNIDYRLAVSIAHTAHVHLLEGNLTAAAAAYLRALSITRNINDAPQNFQIMIIEILGDIRISQGHFRLAKRHFARSIELREKHASDDLDGLTKAMLKHAHTLSELGDADGALAIYQRTKFAKNRV